MAIWSANAKARRWGARKARTLGLGLQLAETCRQVTFICKRNYPLISILVIMFAFHSLANSGLIINR